MTDAEPYDPYAPRVIERKKRETKRTVEAMADTAEFSAELADAGLISAEAHDETVRLTIAISEKFGGKAEPDDTNVVAAGELRQFIEQIEFLESEVAEINDDKSDRYKDLKGRGYDVPAVKTIIRMRRKDRDQRLEEAAILRTYMDALGMD